MNDYPDAYEGYISRKKSEVNKLKKKNDELEKKNGELEKKNDELSKELEALQNKIDNLNTDKVEYDELFNEFINENRKIKINYYAIGYKTFRCKRFHIRLSKSLYYAVLSAVKNNQTTTTSLINYAIEQEMNSSSDKRIEFQDQETKSKDIYFNLDWHIYNEIVNIIKPKSINQYINNAIFDYLHRDKSLEYLRKDVLSNRS